MGSTHEGPAARPRGRASARSPRPARGHLTHQPVRQPDHGVADAHQYVDPRLVATEAGAVPVLADRPRSRPTRCRHRPRAHAAASGSGDRLAGPTPGDHRVGGREAADPPGQPLAGQRVRPHRVRGQWTRPALLPDAAPDGRDPPGQLHGLPRGGRGAQLRRDHRRRGVGRRLLLAREPRAQTGPTRLAHRLRRLPPDAGPRAEGGVPDRRLQRRNDRAHRPLPVDSGPRHFRRRGAGHRARRLRAGPADHPGLDLATLRLLRLHHRLHPALVRRAALTTPPTRVQRWTRRSASSPSGAAGSAAP